MVYEQLADGRIPAYWDHDRDPDSYLRMVNGFTKEATHGFLSSHYPSVAEAFIANEGWPTQLTIGVDAEATWKRFSAEHGFFYPVTMHWWANHKWDERARAYWQENFRLDQEVVDAVRAGRCKILLNNIYEGWASRVWIDAIDAITYRYDGLTRDGFVVVSNNIGMTGEVRSIGHVTNQCYRQRSGGYYDIDEMHRDLEEGILSGRPRRYRFVSLNRQPAPCRWIVLTELFEDRSKGLLSFGLFTDLTSFDGKFSDLAGWYREEVHRRLATRGTLEWHARLNFEILAPEVFDRYISQGIEQKLPLVIDDGIDIRTNPTADNSIDKFTDTYLHIVNETYMQDDEPGRMHFSEKTFKPMWYLQPFVICGQRHSLRRLRDLGYATFPSWIDEDYDGIEDDVERTIAAISSAKDFYNQPMDALNRQMAQMLPILKHNFRCLQHNSGSLHTRLIDSLSRTMGLTY